MAKTKNDAVSLTKKTARNITAAWRRIAMYILFISPILWIIKPQSILPPELKNASTDTPIVA